MNNISEWASHLANSPWILVVLFLVTMIDGFFPPIPSESVVIAVAVVAVSSGSPNLWLVGVVAAAGAFIGDQIAFTLGRRLPVRKLRLLQSIRAQKSRQWVEASFARSGASLIISGRFVPVGRVAVNMTAGAVRYPRRRFGLLAAIAAFIWAAFCVLIGSGAAHFLAGYHPVVGIAAGVAGGLLIGFVVDILLQQLRKDRRRAAPNDNPALKNGVGSTSQSPTEHAPGSTGQVSVGLGHHDTQFQSGGPPKRVDGIQPRDLTSASFGTDFSLRKGHSS